MGTTDKPEAGGQMPYCCEYCDRWYRREQDLVRHSRKHTPADIVLFGRDVAWHKIERTNATGELVGGVVYTVARLIQAGHSWEWWQVSEACHDAALDLVMSEQSLS